MESHFKFVNSSFKLIIVKAELDNLNKPIEGGLDDEDEDSSSATPSRPSSQPPSSKHEDEINDSEFLPFPDHSLLNSRVRKLVSAFQRESKKEEARLAAKVSLNFLSNFPKFVGLTNIIDCRDISFINLNLKY